MWVDARGEAHTLIGDCRVPDSSLPSRARHTVFVPPHSEERGFTNTAHQASQCRDSSSRPQRRARDAGYGRSGDIVTSAVPPRTVAIAATRCQVGGRRLESLIHTLISPEKRLGAVCLWLLCVSRRHAGPFSHFWTREKVLVQQHPPNIGPDCTKSTERTSFSRLGHRFPTGCHLSRAACIPSAFPAGRGTSKHGRQAAEPTGGGEEGGGRGGCAHGPERDVALLPVSSARRPTGQTHWEEENWDMI